MKLFGLTLRETLDALHNRVSMGGAMRGGVATKTQLKKWEALTRIAVSGFVLLLGAILVSQSDPSHQKVGAGFIGVVTGYWLR